METLAGIYMALTVFGVGVTLVDFFGFFGHDGPVGHPDGGGAHVGGAPSGETASGAPSGEDAQADHLGTHDHASPHHSSGGSAVGLSADRSVVDSGRGVAPVPRGTGVTRAIFLLRMFVYFALGAGPTGLIAGSMKLGLLEGLSWSVGAGLVIAVLVRMLKSFLTRDISTSFSASDFLMEEAEITIPIEAGKMGKALVRKFGSNSEVFVRAREAEMAFAAGDLVRIVDIRDDCYLVEASDQGSEAQAGPR